MFWTRVVKIHIHIVTIGYGVDVPIRLSTFSHFLANNPFQINSITNVLIFVGILQKEDWETILRDYILRNGDKLSWQEKAREKGPCNWFDFHGENWIVTAMESRLSIDVNWKYIQIQWKCTNEQNPLSRSHEIWGHLNVFRQLNEITK